MNFRVLLIAITLAVHSYAALPDEEFSKAVKDGDTEYVKSHVGEPLLQFGEGDRHPLVLAINRKREEIFCILLPYANRQDLGVYMSTGWNLLHLAVERKSETVVAELLRVGVNVYAVDGTGYTPMHVAKDRFQEAARLIVASVPKDQLRLFEDFERIMFAVSRKNSIDRKAIPLEQQSYEQWLREVIRADGRSPN